jgi:hypothetical protein
VPVRDRPGQPHLSSCSHYKRLILHAAIAASAIGSYHDWDLTEAEAEPETGPFFGHGLYTKIDPEAWTFGKMAAKIIADATAAAESETGTRECR